MSSWTIRTTAMIGVLGAVIMGGATILAPAPAMAERYDPRYPVCLQKWEWGGSSTVYCSYPSWEACKAAAAGLSAMCMDNPYWSQSTTTGAARAPGRPAPSRMW
ncbi:DUF3551 domain-containing protein [Bradyrhizobium sp. CCGUVB1N3]|uniref:DUF3551 domain-containing protein n=1 Tax=Bradyrhizobium sp. CCGUVB1N3 TaxID=2949629 RepID=UPI0020B3019C|nr:DUF3551 domain-containing protein [Bradyrhizobium sp. CCGUVB1N3]MCP3470447.1 DUF3551 domain-containing protein [Bradyrhizobium sp. CCGUVB1N3]